MRSNPFTSATYESIWLKYYGDGKQVFKFNFLEGVKFIKGKFPGQYVNIGNNYTSGLFYSIDRSKLDYKGKSFVVYDVPEYLHTNVALEATPLKIRKIRQYKGLYVDISKYQSIDDVISNCYNSSKSRYNFRRSVKQLHENHDITQRMFWGNIDIEEYNLLIRDFERILETRFDALNTHNTVLPMWDFYKEVLFPLINHKQVALFVMYDKGAPIAMSFSFVYDDILVVALRKFDISYSRIGLGNIEIYNLIQWCLEHKIRILDFSKGESDYKDRWCDSTYVYHHHIIYDSTSLKAKLSANSTANFYKFKQYLRDRNINSLVTKRTYKLKHLNEFSKQQ
ncbi:GNAT family N-acetyltransferase [Gelidibacter sp. F2691]|nr:GNAT family N-acetyltransferase [Gelidibacter sp. F2691]